MEVHRGNLDVWVKGVLIEQDCATSVVSHKDPIRQAVVVKVFD